MSKEDDQYSRDEAERRRDQALKRALQMPPKPHKKGEKNKTGGDGRKSTKG